MCCVTDFTIHFGFLELLLGLNLDWIIIFLFSISTAQKIAKEGLGFKFEFPGIRTWTQILEALNPLRILHIARVFQLFVSVQWFSDWQVIIQWHCIRDCRISDDTLILTLYLVFTIDIIIDFDVNATMPLYQTGKNEQYGGDWMGQRNYEKDQGILSDWLEYDLKISNFFLSHHLLYF